MYELFKAELLRFRMWSLTLAGVHFIALGFLTRMIDLAQQPLLVYRAFAAAYVVVGLALGLYQMGTYRKPNAWLNLLHRPLASPRIAIALMLAGAVLLAVAVALPIALVALWQETMTPRVVDLRHWLLALAALQIAVVAYLAGAYGMLGERRYSASALVFLLLLFVAEVTGFVALALQLLTLLWLAAMVMYTFKPDLDAPPRRIAGLAIVALPLMMSAFLMMMLTYSGVEMLWIAQGSHPNNTATPRRGGHAEVVKTDERTRMTLALRGSTHPDAPLLREQIALSEPMSIAQLLPRLPHRHELTNVDPMEFDDRANGLRWVFSHDDMRLHGYRLRDVTAAGRLGVGADNAAFPAPALPVGAMPGGGEGDVMLIAGNIAYQYAADSGQVLPRIRLPRDEWLIGASAVGESLGAMSDKALYFFDSRDLVEHRDLIAPRLRVPMPRRIDDLGELEMIELVDGYLIVFSYTARAYTMYSGLPQQITQRVHDDGRIETIARRTLTFDYPDFYRYQGFVSSPVLNAVRMKAQDQPSPGLPVPRGMWLLAASLSLLSVLVAASRMHRLGIPRRVRIAWLAVCGLIGLPALGALWLLYRPEGDDR